MMPNCWQYRLFILSKDGVLTYYDTEVPDNKDIFDSKERGRIDLKAIKFELITDSTEGAPTHHTIIIQPEDGEKWKLCADTKEDHSRWWKAIEKFVPLERSAAMRPSLLNMQSDDEAELMSPTGKRGSKRMEALTSPLAAKQSHNNYIYDNTDQPVTTPTVSPKSQSPVPAPAPTGKRRLKLGKESSSFSVDWMEWVLVMVIVNICLYGIIRTDDLMNRVMYAIALNAVVGRTLQLRAHRHATASATATATAAAASSAALQSSRSDNSQHSRKPSDASVTGRDRGRTNSLVPAVTATASAAANAVQQLTETVIKGEPTQRSDSKPLAGATMKQVFTEPKLSPEHTWCKADFRQFNVRIGPDYNRYKKKAPSAAPIYEPFAVDVFCTKLRADHCCSRFEFADPNSSSPLNVDTHNKFVPPVFVIQIQIPSDPPSGYFTSSDDGPGWAILMYYRITPDAVEQLKDLSTASPAVKLFAEWCEKCTEDPLWRGRFKVINSCTNLDELGIPSAISAYNAKPIMIRRTGSISRGTNDGIKYMEMDIHVHKFATLAKQSIHYISSRCGQMFMQIGFVIEGVSDPELPETLFACVAVNKPQEELAEFIFDEEDS